MKKRGYHRASSLRKKPQLEKRTLRLAGRKGRDCASESRRDYKSREKKIRQEIPAFLAKRGEGRTLTRGMDPKM